MRYRQLGDSGLTVSVVGLGCNNLGRPNTRTEQLSGATAVIDACIDAGITLFDVADTYGAKPGLSESILGQALGKRRADVVVATKFGMDMGGANGPDWGARGSRRYIRRAVQASLTRLGTDYIDLYQYHVPDGITPIEETLAALGELVDEGKVRYVGSSNFRGWQVVEADFIARAGGYPRCISAQNNYNLLERDVEAELRPACEAYGVGILPFFPLANGLLSGKYRRDQPPPAGTRLAGRTIEETTFDRLEQLAGFAADRGHTLLELAIAALASRPPVASVIAGATRPEQIAANVAAADWVLDNADLVVLDALGTDTVRV